MSFEAALNAALRRGLSEPAGPGTPAYRVPTRSMGLRPGIDLDKVLRLAGEMEDEQIVRKLDQRK